MYIGQVFYGRLKRRTSDNVSGKASNCLSPVYSLRSTDRLLQKGKSIICRAARLTRRVGGVQGFPQVRLGEPARDPMGAQGCGRDRAACAGQEDHRS
jgi:hypothetical protein